VGWRKKRVEKSRGLIVGAYDGEVIKEAVLTREDGEEAEGLLSSESSTLEGMASLQRKDINEDVEETPLLPAQTGPRTRLHRPSILGLLKSWLMYQPPPIPFFNKTLPSNGITVLVAGLFGLNAFYSFYHINFTVDEIFVLADRMGSLFIVNLPLLYLCAAKTQPLKALTGRSYEYLNIFHRRLGEILCLQGLLHASGMLCVWYTLFRPSDFKLTRFLLLPVNLLGIGAFVSYETLYFTSLASFRQRWYELFLGSHIFLQTAGMAFLFFHHTASRPYVGAAFAITFIDRIIYRGTLKSTTVSAEASVMEDGETVKLSTQIIQRPRGSPGRWFARCIRDGWQATDHVFISIPSLGGTHVRQAHPFTISSAAPLAEDDQSRLELLIRAQAGFSRDLLDKARHHSEFEMRIDGPYGSSHARSMLEDAELAICVAGGSGIAVVWPLVHHLLDISRSTSTEIVPTSVLRRQKIVLVWVVHKQSHLSWVDQQELIKFANNGVEVIVPPATEDSGRPDLEGMVGELVERYGVERKVGVVASGPDSMGRGVRNTCARLVREGVDIDVTVEKFGW